MLNKHPAILLGIYAKKCMYICTKRHAEDYMLQQSVMIMLMSLKILVSLRNIEKSHSA